MASLLNIDGTTWTGDITGATAAQIGINSITNGTCDIVATGLEDANKYIKAAGYANGYFEILPLGWGSPMPNFGDIHSEKWNLRAKKTGTITPPIAKRILGGVSGIRTTPNTGIVCDIISAEGREGVYFSDNGSNPASSKLHYQQTGGGIWPMIPLDTVFELRITAQRQSDAVTNDGWIEVSLNGRVTSRFDNLNTEDGGFGIRAVWSLSLLQATGIEWHIMSGITAHSNDVVPVPDYTKDTPHEILRSYSPAIESRGDFDIVLNSGTAGTVAEYAGLSNDNNPWRHVYEQATTGDRTYTIKNDVGALTYKNGYATVMLGEAVLMGVTQSITFTVKDAAGLNPLAVKLLNGTLTINATTVISGIKVDSRYNIGLTLGSDGTVNVWVLQLSTALSEQVLWSGNYATGWTQYDLGKISVQVVSTAGGTNKAGFSFLSVCSIINMFAVDSLSSADYAAVTSPSLHILKDLAQLFTWGAEADALPGGYRQGDQYGSKYRGLAVSLGRTGGAQSTMVADVLPGMANLYGVRYVNPTLSINDINGARTPGQIIRDQAGIVHAFVKNGNECWLSTDVPRPVGVTWTQGQMDDFIAANDSRELFVKNEQSGGLIQFAPLGLIDSDIVWINAPPGNVDTHPDDAGYQIFRDRFVARLASVAEPKSFLDGLVTAIEFDEASGNTPADSHGVNLFTTGGSGATLGAAGPIEFAAQSTAAGQRFRILASEQIGLDAPIADNYCVELWAWNDAGEFGYLFNFLEANAGWNITQWNTLLKLQQGLGASTVELLTTGGNVLTLNAWNQIVLQHEHGVGLACYINNHATGDSLSQTAQVAPVVPGAGLGASFFASYGGGFATTSRQAYFRKWNGRLFNAAERTKLWNNGNGLAYSQFGGGGGGRLVPIMAAQRRR